MTSRLNSPQMEKDQRLVSTPYGRGLVVSKRPDNGMQEIHLIDWKTASSLSSSRTKQQQSRRSAILYSPVSYKSVPPQVGNDVVCLYGRGRVIAMRPPPHECVVVLLDSWRLAGRNRVTCYLNLRAVQVVRKKEFHEMDAWERVRLARELKNGAQKKFAKQDYTGALLLYAEAIEAVRYVQHNAQSSNYTRADLVNVMVTCSNNAGTCCIQLKQWEDAIRYSTNARVLIDAMYEKRGLKIHTILNEDGYVDARLFGEFKVKSLIITASAWNALGEYAKAIDMLKQAHEIIFEYTTTQEVSSDDPITKNAIANMRLQAKQVQRLRAICVQRKKALKIKEKQRAQAMFASSSTTNDASNKSNGISTSPQEKTPDTPTVPPSPKATKSASEDGVAIYEAEERELEELEELPSTNKTKSVSFAENTLAEEDTEEEEIPWYEEHREALMLSALACVAALSVALFRSRK